MLYAVIMRFDSLREITASLLTDARKLPHLGITFKIGRSTLADANKRRPEAIFEAIYRDLYATYRHALPSDSRTGKTPKWMKRLQIIDSTTITLFSNLLFKGVGRHPKTGKKKGGIKVHTVIHANEGVPSDIRFTSAATNESFMLKPSSLSKGDIVAMDRAYIDYEKFEQLTNNQVIYVTKMKKSLKYEILSDTIYQAPEGVMEVRVQEVKFTKKKQDGETITHYARIITYVDVKKHKLVSLLTNDKDFDPSEIIEIYRQRWEIELLFKQIKQNFPLRYFYGESANAIKIQIWVTLIANLLLMVMQKQLKRPWSFSGLATMVRITLMNYVDFYSLFNFPEKDWEDLLAKMGQGHMEAQLLFE
jgi:predicted nucleic acid-binding protein